GLREGNRDRLAGARDVVGVLGNGIEGEALVARRNNAAYAQVAADERQGVRLQTLQQVRIFLGQNGVKIERYIVDVRIGGDDLVLEGGSGEIERSPRHALGFYLLRVVGIDETVHVDADIGAVIVLPAAVDLLEAVRLERRERACLLPALEILHRLQDRHVDAQGVRRHLLVDLSGVNLAWAAGHRHGDAGITLNEPLCEFFVRRSRPAADPDQRGLRLGSFIEGVERLRRGRAGPDRQCGDPGGPFPQHDHAALPPGNVREAWLVQYPSSIRRKRQLPAHCYRVAAKAVAGLKIR